MAHDDTVLVRFLKLAPRHEFETDARRHHEGRKLPKMTRWSQFAAMAMGQLFGRLLRRCQVSAPGHGFRFRNKLYSLDR